MASHWIIVFYMLHGRFRKVTGIASNEKLKVASFNTLVIYETLWDLIFNPISVYRVYDGIIFTWIEGDWNIKFVNFFQVNFWWGDLSIQSHVHSGIVIIFLEFFCFEDLQKVLKAFKGWSSRIMSEVGLHFFDI